MGIIYEHIGSLPQVLPKEEEQKWIMFYYQERDEKAREMLITHNLRLVGYVITKCFPNTGLEYEDLFSTGTIGLVRAVDTFVPSRGVQLNSYATYVIKNEILMLLRDLKRKRGAIVVSMEDPVNIGEKDKHEVSVQDCIADDSCVEDEVVDKMYESEKMKKINSFLAKIDKDKREVFEKLWGINGEEKTKQSDVAEEFGMSQSYVSRISAKIIRDLGRELKK